jgi:hypothetical protein
MGTGLAIQATGLYLHVFTASNDDFCNSFGPLTIWRFSIFGRRCETPAYAGTDFIIARAARIAASTVWTASVQGREIFSAKCYGQPDEWKFRCVCHFE